MLRFAKVRAGWYQVLRKSDGQHIATIESGRAQGCCEDPHEWLITYLKPDFYADGGEWADFAGDIVSTYRDARAAAVEYAATLRG